MIKHIVMWTLKDISEHGPKAQTATTMKDMLEGLAGKVPTLKAIEVSLNIVEAAPACDVVLYTEFDDKAGLDAYQVHPEHQKCVAFVKQVVQERRVLDYEI